MLFRRYSGLGMRFAFTIPLAPWCRQRLRPVTTACLALTVLCGLLGHASDRPGLMLEQPPVNAVVGAAEVSVSGVYEGELVSVSCNERDGVVFGSKFVVERVPLTEGRDHLLVKATDAGGQISEAALDLVCDLTPPRVKLVEPKAGTVLGVFWTRVSGTVTDATAVTMRVNGMPVEVLAGRFEADVPLLEGANTIRPSDRVISFWFSDTK